MSHSGPLDYSMHADTQRLENSAHSAIQEGSHLAIFESQLFLDFCSCYEIVSDLLLLDCVTLSLHFVWIDSVIYF